ncbi:homogentisate 1,2-dioxygenase [uncultured Sphingomonas sp.]|uniref:homogentisate 1,2-dioxygenase n=1 Tax=Sphingomonas sp. TaxID=28214 RepID=UPI00262E7ADE|nr:homogentisate 1,2-dioxygenase [uncultured Sphingomonas sp.]
MLAMLAHAAALAAAQAAAPAPCPTSPAPLPAMLSGWRQSAPVAAAQNTRGVSRAMLPIGTSVRAALHPFAELAFTVPPPPKASSPAAQGGLFAFSITRPGRYRVALDAPAWVDVVAAGRAATAVAHGHGPACSGIRKMVDFDLRAGRYLLQVAGHEGSSLTLMVTPTA